MNKCKLLLLMVAGSVLTYACTKHPQPEFGKIPKSNDIHLKILNGVTTQDEVFELYGMPDETTYRLDMVRHSIEIWTYDRIWGTQSLFLYFDSNDTVFYYRFGLFDDSEYKGGTLMKTTG